jgi:hypothetical protein
MSGPHGEQTKVAIAEQKKFSALLKMLRAGLTPVMTVGDRISNGWQSCPPTI